MSQPVILQMTHMLTPMKTLESNFNFDLKNLEESLKANRLSLNVKTTKLFLFHSKYDRVDSNTNAIMEETNQRVLSTSKRIYMDFAKAFDSVPSSSECSHSRQVLVVGGARSHQE